MKHKTSKKMTLNGTSPISIEDAIQRAVAQEHKLGNHLSCLKLKKTRGKIDKGKVVEWHVLIKVGIEAEN